jgi:hypothetical protein
VKKWRAAGKQIPTVHGDPPMTGPETEEVKAIRCMGIPLPASKYLEVG